MNAMGPICDKCGQRYPAGLPCHNCAIEAGDPRYGSPQVEEKDGRDLIPCGCCEGSGQVFLGEEYQKTLDLIRKSFRRPAHVLANRDHKNFGCRPTALNNRLRRLEELGFLTSVRSGRVRRFYLNEEKP